MIKYYTLTEHETDDVVEILMLSTQRDYEWVRELIHHCLEEGKIVGAFDESQKLIGVGLSFSSEPHHIKAQKVTIGVLPISSQKEVVKKLTENLQAKSWE